ncbi:MAG: RHS repeat-associated core domain-containing protein, partial [Candidatus Saccharimonadales bacterium]
IISSTGDIANNLLYTGSYMDPNSNLNYDQARFYDAEIGQFMSVDSLVEVTEMPYSYVAEDPINSADPSGEICGLWGSNQCGWINPALSAIHTTAEGITIVASLCAVVTSATIVGSLTCGTIALLSAGVQASTGTILHLEGCESTATWVSDLASLGGAGMASEFAELASQAKNASEIADSMSNTAPLLKSFWYAAKSGALGGAADSASVTSHAISGIGAAYGLSSEYFN